MVFHELVYSDNKHTFRKMVPCADDDEETWLRFMRVTLAELRTFFQAIYHQDLDKLVGDRLIRDMTDPVGEEPHEIFESYPFLKPSVSPFFYERIDRLIKKLDGINQAFHIQLQFFYRAPTFKPIYVEANMYLEECSW